MRDSAEHSHGEASYAALETADGSWTLVHPGHGEACHSRSGAWLEARERYAVPCRLAERAAALGGARALRLLDLGTGPGWNLAAALEAVSTAGGALAVDTFESDLALLRAGLALPAAPPPAASWIERVRATLLAALERLERAGGTAAAVPIAGGGGELRLHAGDARETLAALPPVAPGDAVGGFDAVFLDGFSPGRSAAPGGDGALWDPGFLREVALRMAPDGLLSSFTSAFAVRLALARAGLGVGRGPAVGAKHSGTLASPRAPLPPLRAAVAARLARFLGPESPPEGESGPWRA